MASMRGVLLVTVLVTEWTSLHAASDKVHHQGNNRIRKRYDAHNEVQPDLPVESGLPWAMDDTNIARSRVRRDWNEWGSWDNWSGWSDRDSWSGWSDWSDHDWSSWRSMHDANMRSASVMHIIIPVVVVIIITAVVVLFICIYAKRRGWCGFTPGVYGPTGTHATIVPPLPQPQPMVMQPFPATSVTYGPTQGPSYPPPQGYVPPPQTMPPYQTGVIPPPVLHPPPPQPQPYPTGPPVAPPAPTNYPINPPPAYDDAMQTSAPTQASYNPSSQSPPEQARGDEKKKGPL